MRTKRKLKTRAKSHVKRVKNSRIRRIRSRRETAFQKTSRRKRIALRRMGG